MLIAIKSFDMNLRHIYKIVLGLTQIDLPFHILAVLNFEKNCQLIIANIELLHEVRVFVLENDPNIPTYPTQF